MGVQDLWNNSCVEYYQCQETQGHMPLKEVALSARVVDFMSPPVPVLTRRPTRTYTSALGMAPCHSYRASRRAPDNLLNCSCAVATANRECGRPRRRICCAT